ncbi:PREDICTED: zinc finger protein CONSTANS-LIKE 2-like [Ipomoea nil]|uniref:zinc finger protein CONSTANS-LIKE 2-like n=1 Tax=Ipomoea nil TaxID=35883 RepID=UPI0009018750|nr:PREDICTED: zinc finger protein CONSTANS-LIKE 2-like [Ipomoea nil]
MLAEEKGYGSLDLEVNKWARVCDVCRSVTCTVYCRTDAAYLCGGCDAHIHRTATAHERVWVCEACERAPAAFLCKADAASLCATCDADVHSANPLARRHHRVPILPIPSTLYGPPATGAVGSVMIRPTAGDTPEDDDDEFLTHDAGETTIDEDDEDEAASWLLLNPTPAKNNDNNNNIKEESENACIDLLEYSSCQENQFNDHHYNLNQPHHYSIPEKNMSYGGGDSVVPNKTHLQYYTHTQTHHGSFQLQGMEYETSTPGYGYPAFISHSVSVSSMDVGVVPESTTSDVSISHSRPPKGTIDLFSGPPVPMASQLGPMDREARVLRYREKKKTRKFEKTIRYASRKAYAETRPRIRGRFAKRTDAEGEVDQMFFAPSMAESGYGIVPLL